MTYADPTTPFPIDGSKVRIVVSLANGSTIIFDNINENPGGLGNGTPSPPPR